MGKRRYLAVKLAMRFEAGNEVHKPKARTLLASIDSTQPAFKPKTEP
ncbi:MAG: hypothetical protein ACJAZ8_002088 [Planctomycetota bacterium]|jgi:hypothetical protein